MKSFLAIFKCAENSKNHDSWIKLDSQSQAARLQKGTNDLKKWNEKFQKQILYHGGSLGKTTKIVDSNGVRDIPSLVGNFIVLQANSHDEAAKMFLGHPHFTQFPGDGIEILERTP